MALKDIPKNTEVTFDYNARPRILGTKTKCLCGSKKCRGYIEKLDVDSEEAEKVEETDVEEDMVFSDLGGIVNGGKNNRICYFSASIQLLFRGMNKTMFQHHLDSLKKKDFSNATVQEKILRIVKTILGGTNYDYSKDLFELARETNNDKSAKTKSDTSDTIAKYENFLDAKRTVEVLIWHFFEHCMLFWFGVYMVEDDQQTHRKKKKKKGTNATNSTISSKVTEYDLEAIISQEVTGKNSCMYHWECPASSLKYFFIEVICDEDFRFEKRLNNSIAVKLNCAATDFSGFAILKSYIYFADHHFCTYVHDR